jgi:hypothetical protein
MSLELLDRARTGVTTCPMRALLAGLLLGVAFATAGCGGGSSSGGSSNGEASKSGQHVLADAVKAADAANSMHMSGHVNEGSGQQVGVDLTIVKGKGAMGSLTIHGQTVDLVVVGSQGYLKAGAAFWKYFAGPALPPGTIAHVLQGKWLNFPTSDADFALLTGLANSTIFDRMSASAGSGVVTNKGATTYNGHSVVDIFGGDQNGSLYVAATGTPYPVAIARTGTAAGSAITFDNWNKSVTLTAPSGATDFSNLAPYLGG